MSYHKPNQHANQSFGGTILNNNSIDNNNSSSNLVLILCDFILISIQQILYERSIYPPHIFIQNRIYNVTIRKCVHEQLNNYLINLVNDIRLNIFKINTSIKIAIPIYYNVKNNNNNNNINNKDTNNNNNNIDLSTTEHSTHQTRIIEKYVFDIKYSTPNQTQDNDHDNNNNNNTNNNNITSTSGTNMQLSSSQYQQFTTMLGQVFLLYKSLNSRLISIDLSIKNNNPYNDKPTFTVLVYTNKQVKQTATNDNTLQWSSLTNDERMLVDRDDNDSSCSVHITPLKAIRLQYLFCDIYVEQYTYND